MWKLILADDESVILNGLQRLVDWDSLGIELVATVGDGEALEEAICSLDPDLVITDIKMPKKTGLTVIKEMNLQGKKAKFIFISGFEEFSYAREAVRWGAVDYLLKPVTVGDLTTAVKKALGQLQEQRTVRIFQEESDELQQMFQQINDGYQYVKEELYQRFAQEHISVEDVFFVGVCFSLLVDEQKRQTMSYEQLGLLRFGIYNRIVEEFRRKKSGFLIKKEDELCHMMAVIPNEWRDNYLEQLLIPLKEQIEADTGAALCMGVGSPVAEVSQWGNSHKTAKFACQLYYFEEDPIIDFEDVNRTYTVSFDDFHHLLEDAFQKIASLREDALDSIKTALDAIESIHYGNRYAAVNRVLLFTGTLLEKLFVVGLVQGDFNQRQNQVQETIRYMSTYRQVCQWLLGYYQELLEEISNSAGKRVSSEIIRVKNYILEHFREDLSIKELAEVACVSQNYFCSLFKKETGENYKTCVTRIRMEEAIRLVLKTEMKTYEIAEAVGYNNVRRFVDAFKGIYKMSPMDYRKLYRKK